MKLREKIIILAAVLFGVYGVLDYFVLSGRADQKENRIQKASQELEIYAATAMANLSLAKAADLDHMGHVISKAESKWAKDSFKAKEARDIETDEKSGAEDDGPELIYSGFIQVGKHFLAVINGMEYRVGEKLEELGYKVSRITPSKVVLLTEANKEIVLYMEEN